MTGKEVGLTDSVFPPPKKPGPSLGSSAYPWCTSVCGVCVCLCVCKVALVVTKKPDPGVQRFKSDMLDRETWNERNGSQHMLIRADPENVSFLEIGSVSLLSDILPRCQGKAMW